MVKKRFNLVKLRERLLAKRQEIFERHERMGSNWQALSEREIEAEEEAQKLDLATLYQQLDILEKNQLEEIDLALFKMASGSYGRCEGCRKEILPKRMEALPETRLCLPCAGKFEEQRRRLPSIRDILSRAELPTEFQEMDEEECRKALVMQLRDDGRITLDDLELACKRGVIYLEGTLPTDSERFTLLRLLDEMGFAMVIDHVRVTEETSGVQDVEDGNIEGDAVFSGDEDEEEDEDEEDEEETLQDRFGNGYLGETEEPEDKE